MKTLTVTEARRNLSSWLRRAKAGEDIGIIEGNRIIALRPVEVVSVDTLQIEEVPVDAATQKQMNGVAAAWKRRKA
jgi:antitoxin (DNA-binding transcriptional repressor) of toxin-antitoxin stability system